MTKTPNLPHSAGHRIIELAYAFRAAKAVFSAVELGIFRELADGPRGIHTLCDRTGLHARGARDFLDALVALDMLERGDDGSYRNTATADLYLVPARPDYLGHLLEHLNRREYPCWCRLTEALQTGRAQFGSNVADHYEQLYTRQADVAGFARAMSGGSLLLAQELARRYPWQRHKTFVDIGCAEGCLPVQIAQVHGHLSGGGFDLPAIRSAFDSYVHRHRLADRLRFYPGDFLRDHFPRADVLVMGRVLHNWDLPTKKMLLTKAYASLEPGGVLMVYERLIDDERKVNAAGLLASLNMLIMTKGGFDYSAADCIGWMREVGFRSTAVEALTPDQSLIIADR